MLSYKNDPELKAKAVADAKSHAEMDRLISGDYYLNGGEDWKGCSVGCFTRNPDGGHEMYPDLLGLPEWLAHLQDRIFEGLDAEHRKWWHTAMFEAIPVGVSLERVLPKIIYWTLTEGLEGSYDRERLPDVAKAVDAMAALHRRWADGDKPSDEEFSRVAAGAAGAAWTAEAAFYKRLADATLAILKAETEEGR